MNSQIIDGTNSGRHIVDGPLTLSNSAEAAPGLLRNTIDQRIVKVRPMSTPIDQISRCAGARKCDSMTVEYYSVDTRPTETKTMFETTGGKGTKRSDTIYSHIIKTDSDIIFEPSETLLVPDVFVSDDNGNKTPLVLYVISKLNTGGIEVMVTNMYDSKTGTINMPDIPMYSKIIRMGRAATELDVQTSQFQALPKKESNNCQIFKMQIEESTFHKIAAKEIGWTFSDQEEAAIIDMRLGMEKNFLFGTRTIIFDPEKADNVYLTGGIWNQAGDSVSVDIKNMTEQDLLDLCAKAFTNSNGSKRKILIAGTGLLNSISRINLSRVINADNSLVKWGIEFKEIRSNFGTLYVIHSEIFDQCGHSGDGIIIDPDNITKYVHVPFHAQKLDLRRSGTRNTSAVVLTEASCVVLRNPKAHLRVIANRDDNADNS